MLGEGTIVGDMRRYTLMHLNASLRYLSEKGSAHKFSKNDAVSIIRYIETDQGEGYFEKETLLQALEATSVGEEEEISKQMTQQGEFLTTMHMFVCICETLDKAQDFFFLQAVSNIR